MTNHIEENSFINKMILSMKTDNKNDAEQIERWQNLIRDAYEKIYSREKAIELLQGKRA